MKFSKKNLITFVNQRHFLAGKDRDVLVWFLFIE